ncbi:MAG: c-type cytochrome domain-containing protein [Verrucomicrobiota bacterium]
MNAARKTLSRVLPTVYALLLALPVSAVDYQRDIIPVFQEKCAKCHSADLARPKGGFAYDDLDRMQREIGPNKNIIPGNWDESWLYVVLSRPSHDRDAMPPEGKGDSLTDAELALVRDWITDGASLERGRSVTTSNSPDADGTNPLDQMTTTSLIESRDWTNREGKTITATLVKIDDDIAILRVETGREYRYPIENLSDQDQALISNLTQIE